MPDLSALEQKLGLVFEDHALLMQALIHRSYLNENPERTPASNERFEFLGDAILGFLAAEFLLQRYSEKSEGQLTLLRSSMVRTETLAEIAARLELGHFLVLSHGEEADGGRGRFTTLADAFEALLGALYLDQGLDSVRRFLLPFLEEMAQRFQERLLDPKSALQIEVQGRMGITPRYRTVGEWGPEHDRTFRAQVLVEGEVLGQGEGASKQAAQQEAARQALKQWGLETALASDGLLGPVGKEHPGH
ncbi:MAG: ribonuclease III [Chloroflexia bacterium]|nr:ribonuclease III [Chloroflexia bacterium]